MAIGLTLALLVFSEVYFSSHDGSYMLDMRDNGEILLNYVMPERTLVFKQGEIVEIRRLPTYKGLWQIILYTSSGEPYRSARATYSDVRKASQFIETRLNLTSPH